MEINNVSLSPFHLNDEFRKLCTNAIEALSCHRRLV
jgi:hypothetical protein